MLVCQVGVRAHDSHLEIFPLAAVHSFCVTRLKLRGAEYSIVWDAQGNRYPHGKGLHIWRDGTPLGSVPPVQSTAEAAMAFVPPRVRVQWVGAGLEVVSTVIGEIH